MNLPRGLILDFGGVVSRTLFETHDLTESALGLAPGSLTWRGPFAPETDELWRDMQRGAISERDYWAARTREVAKLAGRDWTRMSEFVAAARAGEPDAVIRPEALAAIASARARSVKLAILSNELDLFYGAEFRSRLPFLAAFELVSDATYTGILKPEPRAYLDCSLALGVAPRHCVFVDDQSKNVAGATAVGMQAVHFDVRDPGRSFAEALALLDECAPEAANA